MNEVLEGRTGGEGLEGETSLGQTDTVCKREPAGYHGNGRGGEGGAESRRKPKKKIKDEEPRVEESSRREMARGSEE